jgi:hypothetical protein
MMFRRTTLALALAGLVGLGAAGAARAEDNTPSDEATAPTVPQTGGRLLILVPHDGNGQIAGRPMVILVPDDDANDAEDEDASAATPDVTPEVAPDADALPDASQGRRILIPVERRAPPDMPWA